MFVSRVVPNLGCATLPEAVVFYVDVHGPVDEAWGVRRFFVEDPAGHVVNVLSHG